MQPLNLPTFAYKLKPSGQGYLIFDKVRRKYVRLTPEEWVRQHFLHYLTNPLGYPPSLVRIEPGVKYNRLQHRADILVYDRATKPLLLVECKAPHVQLNHDTWGQIVRYNAQVNAQLLVITNGLQHFCWQLDYVGGNHALLPTIPPFDTIVQHKPTDAAGC